jgi:peptide/nickel transport system permease protein
MAIDSRTVTTPLEAGPAASPSDPGADVAARGPVARRARWRRQPALLAAVTVLATLLVGAFAIPLVWPHDPYQLDLSRVLQAPSAAHPMGTDSLGRDLFARFLRGAQISILVGAVVTLSGALLGGTLGVLAGTSRRFSSGLLNWVINALLAFPSLLLAMAVAVALGAGITPGMIGLVIASVPWFARVIRSEALRLSSLPFVESTIALGADRRRVVLRHTVPHILPTLSIQCAAGFGWAVLTMAALGFVGLGAQAPEAEWGAMITDGMQYATTGQWWIGIFPGLGLVLAVFATAAVSDRLREVLDPRGEFHRG